MDINNVRAWDTLRALKKEIMINEEDDEKKEIIVSSLDYALRVLAAIELMKLGGDS